MTESRVQQAVSCFGDGFSCAQAVISTYGVDFGLDRETALRVAGAFGGGMARLGETCGAVTGAFMLLGLRHASATATDKDAKEKTYAEAQEFARQFVALHGATRCRELLGLDVGTPEGQTLAKQQNLFQTRCPRFVQSSAELMEQFIVR